MANMDEIRKTAEELFQAADVPTGLLEATGGLHEMYLSIRKGGFTKMEALWIIAYIFSDGATLKEDPS